MADPEEKALVDKVGWVFPNQESRGTHVNVSGAGVLKNAPHREAAVKFLEYLASPERSEEHTSELQSLMRISYAVFCLKKKKTTNQQYQSCKQIQNYNTNIN